MMSALQLVEEYLITKLAFIVTCVGLVLTLLVLSPTLPGNPIEKAQTVLFSELRWQHSPSFTVFSLRA